MNGKGDEWLEIAIVMPRSPIWLTMEEAVERFCDLYGGEDAVQAKITSLLKKGRVRATARHVYVSASRSVKQGWSEEFDKSRYKRKVFCGPPVSVSVKTWRKSECWSKDVDKWNWQKSDVVITIDRFPIRQRLHLRGVLLLMSDIKFHIGKGSKGEAAHSGRRRNTIVWREFWHFVIDQAIKGHFSVSPFKSKRDFIRKLLSDTSSINVEDNKLLTDEVEQLWQRYRLTR